MENTDIITSDEAIDTAIEGAAASMNWVNTGIAVVAACAAAYLAYKYVAKPIYHKLQAKKSHSESAELASDDEVQYVEVEE